MPLKLSPTQIAFNARGDGKFNRPFQEQVDFFRGKLNLPTERWDDIQKAAHDRAFIVAGAAKADLLNDLRDAVDKAIVNGESIQAFRKRFDAIVKKHGWEGWTGSSSQAGRDWRTRVIYQTNLSTSYAAGRFKQLNDPDLASVRPYWKYIHSDTVQHPRPLHVSWSGMVLHKDDPWWKTHMPPNGWGCRCRVHAVRVSEYKGAKAPDDGTHEHIDSHGNRHTVPNGIDFGFDYQPGANRTTTYADLIDRKLLAFPAPLGSAMWHSIKPAIALENTLRWADTLDTWLSGGRQWGRTAIVGAIEPDILRWLTDKNHTLPRTAEIAIREGLIRGQKQERHTVSGDALTAVEWRRLPSIIANPDQVFFDTRTGKLVYAVASVVDNNKIIVRFEYKKDKPNAIVSGYRQATKTINEMIKGGLYVPIR